MSEFSTFFYFIGALALQYFFSTRNSIYWGAIIPVGYISLLSWLLITNHLENTIHFILIMIVGLAFFIAEWFTGRKSLYEQRKKELDKMKTYDMN